ncbi:MAG: aminodeoxychorismate lyase, partial [Xanthomonadales bacterium]
MLECLVDGEIASQVSAGDRGLHFGDGLIETVAIVGGRPWLWQGHMDRLAAGCDRLGLTPVPQAVLLREVQTVSAGQGDCLVHIVLTRRSSDPYLDIAFSDAGTRRVVCAVPRKPRPEGLAVAGLRARICDLRLAVQPALSGISHLNRLEWVRARAEWTDERIGEGILLDRDDFVVSGISANLFLVFGDRILTPRLDRCGVRGVLRAAVIGAFRERCEQRRIGLDMLPEADEVFLAGVVDGIVPVNRIDHWEYAVGPVTREVQAWLEGQ